MSAHSNASATPYLVTGAAGFIGSHSVDRLLADGHHVVGVDNFRTGREANLSAAHRCPRFTFEHCNVADPDQLQALFARYRFAGTLHLAALVSVPESIDEPALNASLNLYASDALARLCVRHACPRLVFASSAAVYGDHGPLPNRETAPPQPLSPYAAAKLASEAMFAGYAASYRLSAVCLRYFNIYGPRQDPSSAYSGVLSIFTERFLRGQQVSVYGDGEQTRDFVAVADVAEANCRALTGEWRSGAYNVCTGQTVSLNQVLALFRERFPDAPEPRFEAPRAGDVRRSLGDPAALQALLGWSPRTPFKTGLDALLDAERQRSID